MICRMTKKINNTTLLVNDSLPVHNIACLVKPKMETT